MKLDILKKLIFVFFLMSLFYYFFLIFVWDKLANYSYHIINVGYLVLIYFLGFICLLAFLFLIFIGIKNFKQIISFFVSLPFFVKTLILFSVLAVFVVNFIVLSKEITGRLVILDTLFLIPSRFEFDYRSFLSFILHFFNFVGFNVTPFFVSIFNRILSLIFVVVFIVLFYLLFGNSLVLFMTSIFFLSFTFLYNSLSVEPIFMSLFFVVLSFLFFVQFKKTKLKLCYVLFLVSVLLSCFLRWELVIFYGLPVLVYLFINSKKFYKFFKYNLVFLFVLFLNLILILNIYFLSEDVFLHGSFQQELSVSTVFDYGSNILLNNLFNFSNFSLSSGNVTLIFHISFFVSIIIFAISIFNFKLRSSIYFLLSCYWLFNVFVLLAFQIEGITSVLKYNLFFLFSGLVLCSFLISKTIDFLNKNISEYLSLIFIFVFIFLIVISSVTYFVISPHEFTFLRGKEYLVVSEFDSSNSCNYIQFNLRYPLMSKYMGLNSNLFYYNNQTIFPSGCYYLYDGLKTSSDLKEGFFVDKFSEVKTILDESCVFVNKYDFNINSQYFMHLYKYYCS